MGMYKADGLRPMDGPRGAPPRAERGVEGTRGTEDRESVEAEIPKGGGGATHSLGVGTNCKTTAPYIGNEQLLDVQCPNV